MPFRMKGFCPFTQQEEDYSHKQHKEPLFARRTPGEPRDITKAWGMAREASPNFTSNLTKFGALVGAQAVGGTIRRAVKYPKTMKAAALATGKGLLTKTIPALAAVHFGGKLIKGIMNRKKDKAIRAAYNEEQRTQEKWR